MRETITSVGYRPALDTPGIGRVHDAQRLLSYGLAVVAGLVVDLPVWQAGVLTGTGLVMFLAALYRLATERTTNPYLLAQTDNAIAGLAIAIATTSPLLTLAVGLFISGAIAASFDAPRSLTLRLGLLWIVPQVTVAVLLRGSFKTETYASAVVLIILLLALALVILVYFGFQARRLGQTLRYRESQLKAVLETTPVVLAAVDRDGAFITLTGIHRDEVATWEGALAASPTIRDVIAEARRDGRVKSEVTVADRVLSVTCDPGPGGTLLLTAYDITTQAQARDRLQELVRSKDQFIAAVSHELRTPLSSVLGFAEIIHASTETDAELHPLIGEVVTQSAEMAAIIDDLLVAARSSFEQIATAPRRVDLTAEVASVVETIAERLVNTPRFERTGTVQAFADPIRVRQIIRNLLTNADRYGGTTIIISARTQSDSAIVEVRDSGTPIPAELQARIFEPYESSGPVRGQPAAIGLGLAVSRTLAQLMGGSLTYRYDDSWSVFELRLPVRLTPTDDEPIPAGSQPSLTVH